MSVALVTLVASFVLISFIVVFQINSTVISFRRNKIEQANLNYTIISLILLIIIPFLDSNYILSIIDITLIVLIMIRLIFSFIYFTYIKKDVV